MVWLNLQFLCTTLCANAPTDGKRQNLHFARNLPNNEEPRVTSAYKRASLGIAFEALMCVIDGGVVKRDIGQPY